MPNEEVIQRSFEELIQQQMLQSLLGKDRVNSILVELIDLLNWVQKTLTTGEGTLTVARDLRGGCERHGRCETCVERCAKADEVYFIARYRTHGGREFVGRHQSVLAAIQNLISVVP